MLFDFVTERQKISAYKGKKDYGKVLPIASKRVNDTHLNKSNSLATRSDLYLFLGKYDEAKEDALAAIGLDDKNICARVNYALSLLHFDQYEQAKTQLGMSVCNNDEMERNPTTAKDLCDQAVQYIEERTSEIVRASDAIT